MSDRRGTPYPGSKRGAHTFPRKGKDVSPATPTNLSFPKVQDDERKKPTPREQEIFRKVSWRNDDKSSAEEAPSTSSPAPEQLTNDLSGLRLSSGKQRAVELPAIVEPQNVQTDGDWSATETPVAGALAAGASSPGASSAGASSAGALPDGASPGGASRGRASDGGASTSPRPETAMEWLPSHVPRQFTFMHSRSAHELKLGMLLMVQHFGPNLDHNVREGHPSRAYTENCGPVYAKVRCGIVVRIYQEWITLVMLYTSNENGVNFKPQSVRDDAIPVFHHSDPQVLEMRKAQKPYLASLCEMAKTNHHAYMTKPQNTILDTPTAIIGMLTSASAIRVLQYYQEYTNKGLLSLAGQVKWSLPAPVKEAISPPLGYTEDGEFTEVIRRNTERTLHRQRLTTDERNRRQSESRNSPLSPLSSRFSTLPDEADNGDRGDHGQDIGFDTEIVDREP